MALARWLLFRTLRRPGRSAAAALAAILALTAVQCSALQPPVPGPGGSQTATPAALPELAGRLLYGRDRALWSLDVRTGEATQIGQAPDVGQITSGRWSPDGTKVAYARYEIRERRYPVSEVVVASADGTGARTVLPAAEPGTFFQAPVWGPGAETLFILHTGRSDGQVARAIERVDLRTSERTRIVDEAAQFDVSADGRWLALVRTTSSWPSIVVFDLQTGEERTLVPERTFDVTASPRFDPASQTLLFSGASGRALPATPVAGLDIRSWFLPKIARAHGPPMDLFSVPIDGGQVSQVAALAADDPIAAWSPDGGRLAVLSLQSLVVVTLPGGHLHTVLNPGGYGSVDWAP